MFSRLKIGRNMEWLGYSAPCGPESLPFACASQSRHNSNSTVRGAGPSSSKRGMRILKHTFATHLPAGTSESDDLF